MTLVGIAALGYLIIYPCSATDISIVGNVKPAVNLTSYIFSGQDVLDPVPYIVSIQYRKTKREWKHLCGGSIISSNYVLTAAHCLLPHFDDYGMTSFRVLAGSNNLRSRIGTSHRIVAYTAHPNYSDEEFKGHDIGLVRVRPRFKFNKRTIAKIEFASSERVMSDIPTIFHGWGYTHYKQAERLQEGSFTTMSDEVCKLELHDVLTSTDICVTSKDLSTPYKGDSGGPLVNERKTFQIGICSYGAWNVNLNYNYPTVFTRVSEFTKWIKNEIRN
ncbi:chymotrypsin-2-like [Eupeodes corollae]|uniref:chymotrypsin-2-like n=1 Tax=Eupeodes corollae TaxID=290404 RepID=UPI002493385F|nr:chymotrypsin-2-like [Eupeodes corollae]